MKTTRVPLTVDSSRFSAEWDVPRASGVHLMQVVELMESKLALSDPQRNTLPPEALEWYRFGGFMIEHVLAEHAINVECQRDATRLQRPGAVMWCVQCDDVIFGGALATAEHCATFGHRGIHATPDAMQTFIDPSTPLGIAAHAAGAIEASGETWMVKEWKCTWKTQRRAGGDHDIETDREHVTTGIWRWPKQTKAYAYLMGAQAAQLDAFFVNGKYAPPVPSGDSFIFTFDERELSGDWGSIVSYARNEGWL